MLLHPSVQSGLKLPILAALSVVTCGSPAFALGYSFPQRMLEKTGFIKGVDLSLVARNLFFIYKDAPFDPDATMSVGNDNQGLDTFGMPSTRNIGFNIKFTF